MSNRGQCSFVSAFNTQLRVWTAANKRISKHLVSNESLLTMKAVDEDCNQCRILVNLDVFDDYYYRKFIEPDLNKYSLKLIDALLKSVHFALSDPSPYTIRYEFKCRSRHLVRHALYSFGAMIY